MAEADGIMAWALVGLKRLMENNYIFSETDRTRGEMKKYMSESSSALTFIEEECAVEADSESFRDEVYNAYKEFCDANGSSAMSKIRFNKELEEHYPSVVRCQILNRKAWRGIRLI